MQLAWVHAYLCSTGCPSGPLYYFLKNCFLCRWHPACTIVWVYSTCLEGIASDWPSATLQNIDYYPLSPSSPVSFPPSLQLSTGFYSPPMLLLTDIPWLLRNALFSVGKHIITLLYSFFITAAYLFMLFFSWHPLSCTCPWLPNFDYRRWDFIRKKMWLLFSLIFCCYLDKSPFSHKTEDPISSSSSLCGMMLVIRGSITYWVE